MSRLDFDAANLCDTSPLVYLLLIEQSEIVPQLFE